MDARFRVRAGNTALRYSSKNRLSRSHSVLVGNGVGVEFRRVRQLIDATTRAISPALSYSDLVNRADTSQPFSPLNRFAVPNLEPELAPWNTGLESVYTTIGAGALIDAS